MIVGRRWLSSLIVLLPVSVGMGASDGGSNTAESVSLCEVLSHPAAYAGKTVGVTVRVLSTKEGASLWSPECRKRGIGLYIEAGSGPGIPELRQALSLHGLADHPVIATLVGTLDPDHFDDIAHRKRSVFKVIAAKDIIQSRYVEHR
jgi:hypothetical protein